MRYRIPGIFYVALVGLWVCGITIFLVQQHAFSRLRSWIAEAKATETDRQAARKGNALSQLQETLTVSSFSQGNSLDRMAPQMPLPPPPQPVPNRRLEDPLKQKDVWMYMTPEELAALPTPEQMFNLPEYGPDGLEKKKLTPAERLYENLRRQQEGTMKGNLAAMEQIISGSADRITRKKDGESHSDASVPAGVRESEKRLKDLLSDSTSSLSSALTRGTGSSLFGTDEKGPTLAEIEAHEDYMKRFRDEVLNARPPSSPDQLSALASPAVPNPAGGLPTGSARRAAGYDPQLGGVSPTYIPSASVDINSKVLNSWNPTYTPPAPPAPKTIPPPTFEAPRRKF
jgi:hypothetical protein